MEVEERREGQATGRRERRKHPRYATDEDSMLLFVKSGLPLRCRILDLSMEGCKLRTMERSPAGTRLHVEVTFKINSIAFRLSGITQWTDGQHLVGIRFVDVPSRRKEDLAELLSELEASAAVEAQKESEEKPAAARQAAEIKATEEADRAQALTEAMANAQKPVPSPQPNALTRTGQAPIRRERRVQPRHEVNIAVAILFIKSGSRLGGRILDLSLSGCRIRTDERFPVGIFTRIEMEFCLKGMPFRLLGVIQGIRDRHNVGIRFLDMSERKRKQVEELMEEILDMQGQLKLAEPGSEVNEPSPSST